MNTYQQLWQSLTPLYDADEAKAIVRTVLEVKYGMTLTDIICGKITELSADESIKLEEIMARLQKAEPVQYVLGEADFGGRKFRVEPGVLIPRPETAELCKWIVDTQKEKETATEKPAVPHPNILDICTGSGCIAITLSLDIPQSTVTGIDISEKAIATATENAKKLNYNTKIKHADVFDWLKMAKEGIKNEPSLDIIVSNPPYICEKEKADMAKNVLNYEPGLALFVPDEDPLRFYRAIAEIAALELVNGGRLYFEINPIYEKETREMLEGFGFENIETQQDFYGKKRMMRAMKK